jgi:hypothetical protein
MDLRENDEVAAPSKRVDHWKDPPGVDKSDYNPTLYIPLAIEN